MSTLDRYESTFRKMDPELAAWHRELSGILDSINTRLGSQPPKFVDSIRRIAPSQPSPVRFSVTAANGVFTVLVVNPQDIQPASMALARAKITKGSNPSLSPVMHNLQSGTDTNFNSSSNLTDYGISSQTSWNISSPGASFYWRIRSSFDGQNWNAWQLYAGPSGPIAVTA